MLTTDMHTLNLKIIADHLQTILSGKSFKHKITNITKNVLDEVKYFSLKTEKMETLMTSRGQQMIQEMLSFK